MKEFINTQNENIEQKKSQINKFWRDSNYFLEINGQKLTLKEVYQEVLKRSKEVFKETKKYFEQIPKDKFILYVNQTEKGMMRNPDINYVDQDRLALINEAETGINNLTENFQVANMRYSLGIDKEDTRFKVFNSYEDNAVEFDLNNCVGVIFSGGEAYITDEEKEYRIQMIRNSRILVEKTESLELPTLGICFGAQLLADTKGGKIDWVFKEDHNLRVSGVEKINSENQNELPENLYIAENHAQGIYLNNMKAEILAKNEDQSLEVFTLGKNIICTQGHPEVGSTRLDLALDLNKKEQNKEDIFKSNIENTRKYFFIEFIKKAIEYSNK